MLAISRLPEGNKVLVSQDFAPGSVCKMENLNLLAPELFFLILAHTVYKM